MYEFGSLSSTRTTLFDSGLSSALTNSTNNSITSGSPPAFASSYIDRPDALFSSLYSVDSLSNLHNTGSTPSSPPTESSAALSSFLDPFHVSSSSSPATDLVSTLAHLTGGAGSNNNNTNNNNITRQMDRLQSSTTSTIISRPTSFNTSSIFGQDYGNPLGAPGTPIGVGATATQQMSVGILSGAAAQQQQQQLTPVSTPTSGNVPPPKNPKLYKTELCRSWMDHGRCNYGERCQYAHGEEEKRAVPRHPKYKTEACQSFHQSGYCPYGPRCHFIHNEAHNTPVFTPPVSATPTPVAVNGQTSRYASQYHNMSMQQQTQQQQAAQQAQTQQQERQQQQQVNQSSIPNNLLQRVYSLPGGYGSAGESPAGSSNDSGSESPNGSFSPGLDLDDTGLFSSGFLGGPSPAKQQLQPKSSIRQQPSRFLSYDQSSLNDNQFSHLLNDICQWNLDDSLSSAFSSSLNTSSPWSNDDLTTSTTPRTTPGRLPVFAQLSNPQ